jgi:hypothetical protein
MNMRRPVLKHKHLKLDQKKIDFAKRYFGGLLPDGGSSPARAIAIVARSALTGLGSTRPSSLRSRGRAPAFQTSTT